MSTTLALSRTSCSLLTATLVLALGCQRPEKRSILPISAQSPPRTLDRPNSYGEATATTSKPGRFRTASHPVPEGGVARTNDAAANQTLTPDLVPALPPSCTTTSALLQGQIESQSVIGPRSAATQPNNFRDLTESEMLSIALASSPVLRPLGLRILENPASAVTTYDPMITRSDPFYGPQAALAEFDSVLSGSIHSQNNDRVFNNRIVGGDTQELVQDYANVNLGWQKRSRTGGIWEISSLHNYDANNRDGNRFPSYWETIFEAGVRQPLLRGAGRQFNAIAGPNATPGFNFSNGIVIARLNDQISDADFELQLRDFVRDLFAAYWDLARQYRDYESVLQAKQLAYQTWQSVLAKNQARLSGGEADKEAQARAKYYELLRACDVALGGQRGQAGLYVAERQLRQMLGLPIVDRQLLRPIDDPAQARFIFDFDALLSEAMTQRTELQRQSLRLHQQQLRLVAAKNFLLPQLDVIGRYRLRGFGDDLTGGGPRFSSAYDDLFSFDHQEWQFGLEMGVAAGRRQAQAAVRNASLQVKREQAILYEQQRGVRHQLGNAVAEVESSFLTMQNSLERVKAARERLDASQALFASDKIRIEFLLDAQEELLRAEVQLTEDQSRYSLALINVNYSAGGLLEDLGVEISNGCSESHLLYQPTTTIQSNDSRAALPIR